MGEFEVWRHVYRITERRSGAVYRTEYVESRWVPMGTRGDGEDLLYVVPSDPDENPLPRKVSE